MRSVSVVTLLSSRYVSLPTNSYVINERRYLISSLESLCNIATTEQQKKSCANIGRARFLIDENKRFTIYITLKKNMYSAERKTAR
jgi:hypothetical protein